MTEDDASDVSSEDAVVTPDPVVSSVKVGTPRIYTVPRRRSPWWLWRRRRVQSTEDLERAELASRNVLRKGYGWSLLAILALQIAFVDWVFYKYAQKGRGWDIDPAVMNVWLGATVVEVIGITTIVVRHLFPRREAPTDPNA